MACDQIAVVAIHRAHEIGEGGNNSRWQTATEASRFPCEVHREVGKLSAMPGTFGDKQGFHQRDGFASIRDRNKVRFFVL